MPIRDHYIDAIRAVMAKQGVQPAQYQPDHDITPSASLEEVLVYADWYVAGTGDKKRHYRFDRYRKALNAVGLGSDKRIVHVDIGCGVGVFSWVVLDWAKERGIDPHNIRLYAYDPCQEAIKLCWMLRYRIQQAQGSHYPSLNYDHNLKAFTRKLSGVSSQGETEYLVTLGYVIAGNHNEGDIQSYHEIIQAVESAAGSSGRVWLVASDATSGGYRSEFNAGWRALRDSLPPAYSPVPGTTGYTGDKCLVRHL